MQKPMSESGILKRELVGLFGHLQKIRTELAALNPHGATDHFGGMAEQLDAIVGATESATNTIMERMEDVGGLISDGRKVASDPKAVVEVLDQIENRVNDVFEACSFQDITGQRISKIVNSMKFVEERVKAIILTWGREELTKVVVSIKKEEEDPDKKLLHGPQLPSQGVSQADVDKLLGQDAIDKLFG